jgi:hypothetical protein
MPNEENSIDVTNLVTLGSERLATLLAEVALTNSCIREVGRAFRIPTVAG